MDANSAATDHNSNASAMIARGPPKQGFRFYKSGSTSSSAPGVGPLPRTGSPHRRSLMSESPTFAAGPADGRSSSAPAATATPLGVDPKLYQIVKRVVSSTPSLLISSSVGNKASQQARKNNTQAVISLVLEKHREYRRKDRNWVREGVELALLALGSSDGRSDGDNVSENKKRRVATVIEVGGGSRCNNSSKNNDDTTTNNSPSPSIKKRRSDLESASSDSFENASPVSEETAIASSQQTMHGNNGALVTLTAHNSGGMLNASLRNRYKDVQRERDRQVAKEGGLESNSNDAATVPEESQTKNGSSVPPSVTVTLEDNHGTNLVDTVSLPNDSTNKKIKPAANSNSTTPKMRKRQKKRTPSKSLSNNNGQDDEDAGRFYSSNAALLQPSPRPTERYSNLGGMSSLLQQLRELIEYPLSRPELFLHLGVEPPRGVLLRGPPGCGKTHLAKAIAGELNVSYFQVSAPELVGGVSGESEQRVRTLFESASGHAPAIVFIDEIDAIAPKRGEGGAGGSGGKSMEKRIVAQLLTSMDAIHPKNTRNQAAVMVLGATNRPDAMDPALRRAGRFDREIVLGAPDEKAREGILRVMTQNMRVDDSLDYGVLAKKTPGFVGADIRSLTKEAAVVAINRIFQNELLDGCVSGCSDIAAAQSGEETSKENKEGLNIRTQNEARIIAARSTSPLTPEQLHPLYITMDDFLSAVSSVQPSAKREGFATVPDVCWDDIGALANIREELTLSVLEPIRHPERFVALGLPLPAGVLLYGPPGCGKTLLAKAIANESGANFISVKGPELLDKYVGESERSVRVVFERARTSSPCIIFFDELDSLCPKRGSDGGGGGGVSERVVNQLLTEMDGLDSRRSVFVIAATNRPELIDPAMLRPGRLDKLLYVPLPSPSDRYSILRALSTTIRLGPDVDLHAIAHNSRASGFSGADCAALLREAGLAVLRDGVLHRTSNAQSKSLDQAMAVSRSTSTDIDAQKEAEKVDLSLKIAAHHFQYAFEHVLPSVSKKDQARYDKLRDRMARARTRGSGPTTENIDGREDGLSDGIDNLVVPPSS